jgi:hypothetical protein
MSQDWIEEMGFSKPGMMVNKDFLNQVKERFEYLENSLLVEKRDRGIAEMDIQELREKIYDYEGDIFGGLEKLKGDNNKIIGIKDREGDKFYLAHCHPEVSELREKLSDLERVNSEIKEKNRILNQKMNRAKKRYIHAEDALRDVTSKSGLKILFRMDGCKEYETGFPYDIPEIYDPRITYPIAQLAYYKGKIWIHKTENTKDSEGDIMVDGVNLKTFRKNRINLNINSKILITAGEPYDEARIIFKNENISVP